MGGRGAGWVVAQFALMAAVIAAGFVPPDWPGEARQARLALAIVLIGLGAGFSIWAGRELGRALTPFPKPNPTGLVTTGPFAVVRHPIYLGLLGVFVGYSLLAGVLCLVATAALAGLWLGKTRVEERLLAAVYGDYRTYCARVRWRILPHVY
jgi:protein-S-isoprenylcysteine O-methyltransferase Ste14